VFLKSGFAVDEALLMACKESSFLNALFSTSDKHAETSSTKKGGLKIVEVALNAT